MFAFTIISGLAKMYLIQIRSGLFGGVSRLLYLERKRFFAIAAELFIKPGRSNMLYF